MGPVGEKALSPAQGATPFAVWLLPEAGCRAELRKLIRELARRHEATPFEPHVTVFAGRRSGEDRVERIVAAAFAGTDALELEVTGVAAADSFFKSVFLTLRPHGFLERASRIIGQRLREAQRYDLQPHLSLLYTDLPLEAKREIATRVPFVPCRILFDELAVVNPGPAGDWRGIARWETEFTLLLRAGRE